MISRPATTLALAPTPAPEPTTTPAAPTPLASPASTRAAPTTTPPKPAEDTLHIPDFILPDVLLEAAIAPN